jgi:hypothetical protein
MKVLTFTPGGQQPATKPNVQQQHGRADDYTEKLAK